MGRSGLAVLAVVALIAACGSGGEDIVGAPGGRNGVELRYASPRAQVVAADRQREVSIAIRVLGTETGSTEPLRSVLVRAVVDEGRSDLGSVSARTDMEGVARFVVRTPAASDKSRIVLSLDADEGSFLPYDVVAAPVVPVELGVGDIRDVTLPSDGALVRISGAAGAGYVFMPFQTDTERTGATYRLFHQSPNAPATSSAGFSELMVPRTRSPESDLSDHIPVGALRPSALELSDEIPGSVNIRSCRIDFDRIAPLRYLGEHVALYVDGPRGPWQSRIDSIGRVFDEAIFPLNTQLYGQTTDLDGNQRVLVVMSPLLSDVGGVYCDTIRTLKIEAFYANWNPADPIDRPLSTLAHEHQHVINAGHHFRTTGAVGDDRWINEGMSYAAEALHEYWGGTMVRMWQFLSSQNNGIAMLPLEYATVFNDRYMMFFLYLRDRFGPATYQVLGTSGRVGVDNVEQTTGIAFETLLRDWFVANAVSNRGVVADPRYNYRSVDLHGMAAEAEACQCVPLGNFDGMTMERLLLDRSFDVARSLDRADADYYEVRVPEAGARPSYDVYFDGFGRASTRLTVIRIE